MADLDLAALRALLAAGTPGPWEPCAASGGRCQCGFVWSGDGDVIVARARQGEDDDCRLVDAQVANNAALIAAAVNALGPLLDALDAAERERDALRAWVREALPYIESEAQGSTGYGYYRPANPHHFSPDHECCTVAEIEAHAAACDAYDRGEVVDSGGCETATTPDGEVVAHILRAPWGIGSYHMGDEDAVRIRDEGRALLGEEK